MPKRFPCSGGAGWYSSRVPIGYLVTTTLVAACTWFALAPLRRPWTLALLSFRFGFLLNELPFLVLYWIVASTLLAVSQGDTGSPGGRAVLGLAVLAALGLLVVARRGMRAGPVVDAALDDGLGAGWRTAVDAGTASPLRRRLPYGRILFAPFAVRSRAVERLADISYGPAGVRNQLDVYRHRSRPTGSPVLVHLHGGRLVSGSKNREALPLIHRLAAQGWLCVSANYRLSPAATFPDHLVDVKKVLAWVREHGHEYGADPSTVFVAGSSSGAQLAALAALTPGDPQFQPGFESADTSVTGAVCLYGYYGSLGSGERVPSSPLSYASADAPPFFVAHGDRDTVLSADGARRFVETLRGTSPRPVVYARLPGAQHSFDLFTSLRFESVVDGVEAFTAWVRATRESPREEPTEA